MKKYWGKVKKGAQRGRLLGFPTANIRIHKKIEEGIYVSKVTISSSSKPESNLGGQSSLEKGSPLQTRTRIYNALTFVGKATTFNEKEYKSESFLLDFSGDLYGKYITILLLQKIRDNKRFLSVDDLIKQMDKDVAVAKKFFTRSAKF